MDYMNLPSVVSYSKSFSKLFLPAAGVAVQNTQYDLIASICNAMCFDPQADQVIARIPGWDRPFDTDIMRPFVRIDSDITFHDAMMIRTQDILSRNKNIKMLWSGGIDSTVILTYLMNHATGLDQITVYYTPESIAENPHYMEYIDKFGVRTVRLDQAWQDLFAADDLIVTGGHGDTICAQPNVYFYDNYRDWFPRPWQDFLKFRNFNQADIDLLSNKLSDFPMPIKTLSELHWWIQNCITGQYWTCHYKKYNLENIGADATVPFFDCYAFDQWSQSHFKTINYTTPFSLKEEYRRAINAYWPNEEYFKTKVKVNSRHGFPWIGRKIILHQQQYLFMYRKDGEFKTFRQTDYPIINVDRIMAEIATL
jgi:hypothetical protein